MQTIQMTQTWKLVGRVPGTMPKQPKTVKGRKVQARERRYQTESGTLVVRTLTETETEKVLALLEEMKAAEIVAEQTKPPRQKSYGRILWPSHTAQTHEPATPKMAALKPRKSPAKKGKKSA